MTNAGTFLEVAYIVDDFSLTVKETNKRKRGCRAKAAQKEAKKQAGDPKKGLPGCRFHSII